jgi:non-specific serine/threonine protein kinase
LDQRVARRWTTVEPWFELIRYGQYAADRVPDRHTNLPLQLTSFVGREHEIATVRRLLDRARLVTLTGAGGSGKTRLALRVAADLVSTYRDGVWIIDLAPLADGSDVPQTVASVLGARADAGRSLPALADFLSPKNVLLVLDNCEHLVAACAELAHDLLRTCVEVHILATSREPLAIAGETTWRVPPLSVPDAAGQTMLQSEAVCLFLERAAAVAPDLVLTKEQSAALVEICRDLDGMPLAIELAAARVDVLSVEQIASRLDDRFRLLATGQRLGLPRHQTLRAAVDWSFNLLSPEEAQLWSRLSVFSGGWSLDSAETVCAGGTLAPSEVLDVLSALVRKSLVVVEPHPTTPRYRLLETMRQYAAVKLEEIGETATLRQRHAQWCIALTREADRHLTGAHQPEWLERLEREHDNVRAALEWSLSSDPHAGLVLSGSLWRFWWMHGYLREGRERLARVLHSGQQTATPARVKALHSAGLLALWQGDVAAARSLLVQALAMAEQIGDRGGAAFALMFLGRVCRDEGDVDASRQYGARAVALFRALANDWDLGFALHFLGLALIDSDIDDAQAAFEEGAARFRAAGDGWSVAMPLRGLGLVAYARGDDAAAGHFFGQSLTLFRERGDAWAVAMLVHDLGCVARRSGNLDSARTHFQEALRLWRRLGNDRGCALGLVGLAGVAAASGGARLAARLYGAARAVYPSIADMLEPTARALYARSVAAARHSAGSADFDGWVGEASAAPADAAIAEALLADGPWTGRAGTPVTKEVRLSGVLSRREGEIAALIAIGRTNREIAAELVIAERTAEAHVEHIRNKLGLRSRAQIAAWAADQGLRRMSNARL